MVPTQKTFNNIRKKGFRVHKVSILDSVYIVLRDGRWLRCRRFALDEDTRCYTIEIHPTEVQRWGTNVLELHESLTALIWSGEKPSAVGGS